jgi:prepilin-type N-terminal cleavage/methylation domain-containing protein
MKKNQYWFTLIEIITGVAISGIVLTSWFYALNLITLSRVKLIEETEITKEAFYLSQKLFEEIKAWGTLDYEEYFNRKVIGTAMWSGHYSDPSWFWNFWSWGTVWTSIYGDGFYYCRSGSGVFMWTGWCYGTWMNNYGTSLWIKPQRYGQYVFQFIDFNINQDDDNWLPWDENLDGNIRNDQDDEHLWVWPSAFTGWTNVKELYLISGDWKKRTLFRLNLKNDPNKPAAANCDFALWTGSGCLGNIEILKLQGKDLWILHNWTSTGSYDWIIDTWVIDQSFSPGTQIVAGSVNMEDYWQPLFSDTIHVKEFKVFAYPNVDVKNAWKSNLQDANINPYVRIDMTLTPSWRKRAQMKWTIPEIKLSTTINLVEYFSK